MATSDLRQAPTPARPALNSPEMTESKREAAEIAKNCAEKIRMMDHEQGECFLRNIHSKPHELSARAAELLGMIRHYPETFSGWLILEGFARNEDW
jgi:hypothetical protein